MKAVKVPLLFTFKVSGFWSFVLRWLAVVKIGREKSKTRDMP
jgi:hypothetical protein